MSNITYGAPKAKPEEKDESTDNIGTKLIENQQYLNSRINKLIDELEVIMQHINALEEFAFKEPSIIGRIEAIETKIFGGIAQIEEVEEKQPKEEKMDPKKEEKEKNTELPKEKIITEKNDEENEDELKPMENISFPITGLGKKPEKAKKSLMAKVFGGPED